MLQSQNAKAYHDIPLYFVRRHGKVKRSDKKGHRKDKHMLRTYLPCEEKSVQDLYRTLSSTTSVPNSCKYSLLYNTWRTVRTCADHRQRGLAIFRVLVRVSPVAPFHVCGVHTFIDVASNTIPVSTIPVSTFATPVSTRSCGWWVMSFKLRGWT